MEVVKCARVRWAQTRTSKTMTSILESGTNLEPIFLGTWDLSQQLLGKGFSVFWNNSDFFLFFFHENNASSRRHTESVVTVYERMNRLEANLGT